MNPIRDQDPDVWSAIAAECERQQDGLEMIASENYTSPAIMQAAGTVLTNKYAEGYPGRRYYGGCEYVDVVENLARDRATTLFGAEHANVTPQIPGSACCHCCCPGFPADSGIDTSKPCARDFCKIDRDAEPAGYVVVLLPAVDQLVNAEFAGAAEDQWHEHGQEQQWQPEVAESLVRYRVALP